MYKTKGWILKGSALAVTLALSGCIVAPQVIDPDELLQMLSEDKDLISTMQVSVNEPLSLGDVMARAVLTNLDKRVSDLETTLALGAFELSRFDMLPSAALSGTYYDRNNENASRSISVLTRQESLEPSTSQEQTHTVSDMRLSWNLLDFGVSYYQAKQEADRYLITDNNRRKALIDLLQQARGAYWRALAAQKLRSSVDITIEHATQSYDEVNQGIEERIYPSMVQALQLKKELFTLIGDLQNLQSDLEESMILLANFINVPSGTNLVLEEPDSLPELPLFDYDLNTLELTALTNSTEILEEAYNARIDQAETRKALLRLLPGLELGNAINYDDNKFLYNNDWSEASLRVSWNLLRLASTRQTLKSVDLRKELQVQRRLAANMAVVTRLNLSLHQYADQLNRVQKARELQSIDAQISSLMVSAVASDSEGRISLVRSQAAALATELTYLMSYAQVQEAYGTVLVSLGLNPLPADYNARSIDDLSNVISAVNSNWVSGDLPITDRQ